MALEEGGEGAALVLVLVVALVLVLVVALVVLGRVGRGATPLQ